MSIASNENYTWVTDDLDARLKEPQFLVEATSVEISGICDQYFQEYIGWGKNRVLNPFYEGLAIKQDSGMLYTIDVAEFRLRSQPYTYKVYPISVLLTWWIVENKYRIGFWEICSQLCFYPLAEKWLNQHVNVIQHNGRKCCANSNNFHNILIPLKEMLTKS